jgi:peroxiredoxin family protein
MSMDAMGVSREELVDGLACGGVATYMAEAARSRVTLFI